MNRIEFLKSLSLLSASLTLFPRHTMGSGLDHKKNFLIFVTMDSGWDVTLATDPLVHKFTTNNDIFIEYRPEDIFQQGTLQLGPAAKPLIAHAHEICVVNGIFMSDSNISHEANLKYLQTGHSEGAAPDIVAQIEEHNNSPFGALFTRSLQVGPAKIRTLQLRNLVQLAPQRIIIPDSVPETPFYRGQKDFYSQTPKSTQFIQQREQLNKQFEVKPNGDLRESERAEFVSLAAGFVSHAAQVAAIEITENLDSHSDHEGQHLERLRVAFERLTGLINILKETPYQDGRLFDATTIVVSSEFARTAALNSAKGKDHNPLTNSVIFIGNNVKGGQTIGASQVIPRIKSSNGQSHHRASLIDYKTGAIMKNRAEELRNEAEFILPENVFSTLAHLLAIESHQLPGLKPGTKIIPGVSKT